MARGQSTSFARRWSLATRQGSRSLALRALMSLSRLRASQGVAQTKSREELAAIYSTFDEGLSTRDLRMARQLLDELS